MIFEESLYKRKIPKSGILRCPADLNTDLIRKKPFVACCCSVNNHCCCHGLSSSLPFAFRRLLNCDGKK